MIAPCRTVLDPSIPESIHCNLETSLARRTAPYLFPCTIEYSLIAAAVMYKIYQNVGHVSKLESSRRLPEMPEDRHDPTDCHKANKGLFFGLFTMVFTFIAMGSFFLFSEGVSGVRDSEVVATFVFMMTEIVLLSVSMISVVVGFIKVMCVSRTIYVMSLLVCKRRGPIENVRLYVRALCSHSVTDVLFVV